ncbi:MAG: LysR family transcriptional regulator, low CO2-responsive transcriptional regulator [Actinomycetota bacterium]|nr:LysR family transcriptional regulator, low CO2-responsive transcriptional regulator [Actinomycetota bacterium]
MHGSEFAALPAVAVTLTQLEAFVLVARLGSVKAAAKVLGVSEPAVSGALAALRQHLGDPLLQRSNTGMELTPGGKRLVSIASQMVNLAVEAEAAIRDAQGAPELLRVVASSTVAEFVAPGLLNVFTARTAAVEASVGLTSDAEMSALLLERLADVGLGPRLPGLTSEPLMRYRLLVVASPDHRLAGGTRPVAAGVLADQEWLLGPSGVDPSSDSGRLLARLGVPESRLRVFGSEAAAWVAAAEGHGLSPAVHHLVAPEMARGGLAPVAVEGTPADLFWYVSSLSPDRRSPAATRLRRFLATPDAMHVMSRADGSVPASRFRPPVYVTLWS